VNNCWVSRADGRKGGLRWARRVVDKLEDKEKEEKRMKSKEKKESDK
jgi:hypothetical protein